MLQAFLRFAHTLKMRENYFDDWADELEEGTANPLPIEVPLVELMWLARDLRWNFSYPLSRHCPKFDC